MAVGLEVELKAEGALRVLRSMRNLAEDPTPLLGILGSVLEANTRTRFDTGRGPGGVAWPVSRRAAEKGGKTLVDKGGLLASLRHEVHADSVEIGVGGGGASTKFAFVHQFGATIRPKNAPYLAFRTPDGSMRFAKSVTVPARPFLGVDQQDREMADEGFLDYLKYEVLKV